MSFYLSFVRLYVIIFHAFLSVHILGSHVFRFYPFWSPYVWLFRQHTNTALAYFHLHVFLYIANWCYNLNIALCNPAKSCDCIIEQSWKLQDCPVLWFLLCLALWFLRDLLCYSFYSQSTLLRTGSSLCLSLHDKVDKLKSSKFGSYPGQCKTILKTTHVIYTNNAIKTYNKYICLWTS